jgi:MerR family transcriptional regulator, light-induced transcriptional regulator
MFSIEFVRIVHPGHVFRQRTFTMTTPSQFVSPRQAARALGVSESSLKRWCDQGLLATSRTAGGHRKISVADVVRFAREHQFVLASPEDLGFPALPDDKTRGLSVAMRRLVDALLAGDELLGRQILLDLYMGQHTISEICDEVIAPAFYSIGEKWEHREAQVYQERRACEIIQHCLFEFRSLVQRGDDAPLALGGTSEHDRYSLPSTMVEVVLHDCGFSAASMGNGIPLHSLVQSVLDRKPKLFWLSLSYLTDPAKFVNESSALWDACQKSGTVLVMGGRALSDSLRSQVRAAVFCRSMGELEQAARQLLGSDSATSGPQSGSHPSLSTAAPLSHGNASPQTNGLGNGSPSGGGTSSSQNPHQNSTSSWPGGLNGPGTASGSTEL